MRAWTRMEGADGLLAIHSLWSELAELSASLWGLEQALRNVPAPSAPAPLASRRGGEDWLRAYA